MNVESLKEYYITSFPSKSVYEWLTRKRVFSPKSNGKKSKQIEKESNNNSDSDSDSDSELEHLTMNSFNIAANNREIAYEYQSGAYGRYLTFPTFKQFYDRLTSTVPNRFEIGAIYENVPKKIENLFGNGKPAGSSNTAIDKEFVFDIDMDDYDPYRTCCSGSQICDSCWAIFINCSIEILSTILYEYFNWNNFFFVYSGRRGLHLWVMDYEARILNDIERSKVMDFLNLCKNRNSEVRLNNTSSNNCLSRPLNPFIEDSLHIASKYFNLLLEEQEPFSDLKNTKKILSTQFPAITSQLNTFYMSTGSNSSSIAKWKAINDVYLKQMQLKLGRNYNDVKEKTKLLEQKEEVVLKYLYPKFDIEVSKKIGHLLKSPFCIHPGTGNVCVPFHISYQKSIDGDVEVKSIDTFKPSTCPNIKNLKETNDFNSYVELFDKFLENYLNLESEREKSIIESKNLKKRKAESSYDW